MQVRPYTTHDLQAILELANSSNKTTHEYIPYTTESMQNWIRDSKPILLIAEEERVRGFIAMEQGWPAGPGQALISLICADSGKDSQEIERTLINSAVRNTSLSGLGISLPIGSPDISQFVEWGFRLDGGFLQLTRTLSDLPPEPTVLAGVRIRGLRAEEVDDFIRLINASYGAERVDRAEIDGWKRDDPLFDYDWIQVAEHEGKLIGAGVGRRDVEYNKYYHQNRGHLGPAGTLPEFRGKGLNKAVNWHALDFLKQKGMDSVSLHTLETNYPVQKLTNDFGYTIVYHWKILRRSVEPTP